MISPGDIETKACLLQYEQNDYPGAKKPIILSHDGILPVGTEGLEGSGEVKEGTDDLPW